MTETARRYMGNSVPRKEDAVLLAGRATFTDDIRLPGMLHLAVLRSPHAHASITAIDTSAAREQPGVVAVFTGDDLADEYEKNPRDNPAAVTGYDLSLHERSQGSASVTDTADNTDGEPVDEQIRTFVAWIVHDELKIPNHWPVARGEVNFAGDIVAVVIATDRYKAQDALEFI